MATLRMAVIAESGGVAQRPVDNTEEPSNDHRRNCISPPPLSGRIELMGASMGASQLSLSLVAASLLHRVKMNPRRPRSPTSEATRKTPFVVPPPSLLGSIPKDVLARDILAFLTDKAVKVFLDSIGEQRLQLASCSELRRQFCTLHGSRLEDPETFQGRGDKHLDSCNTTTATKRPLQLCCPECYANENKLKRCNGCRVFYPTVRNPDHNDNDKSFPALWCQKCDRMAFCNACLSNDEDGCGSEIVPSPLVRCADVAFGAFGRKIPRRRYCNSNRVTCHNYCCPNVFTNTMCGEFICDDCGDERQRLSASGSQTQHDHLATRIDICRDCGKATCLDPNCLVCADFRLIHMSCEFVPEDAYNVGLGDILFGSKTNGSNSTSDLSTKLRKTFLDGAVFLFIVVHLWKMWWLEEEQQQQLIEIDEF